MQNKPSSPQRNPPSPSDADREEVIPIDEVGGEAISPTVPPVVTAQDDDEGGADPIDPETGRPYEETDPGTEAPPAERRGGTSEG